MNWIDCKDELPPLDVYVLGYYCGGNWHDNDDDPNREVVKRVAVTYYRNPNNRGADYTWATFGPAHHFAHEISHWCHIPTAPSRGPT